MNERVIGVWGCTVCQSILQIFLVDMEVMDTAYGNPVSMDTRICVPVLYVPSTSTHHSS
jgi:hypothetical protein